MSVLKVASDSVFSLEDCTQTDAGDYLNQVGEYELPFGSLIWENSGNIAACLLPTETSSPLTQVGLLTLTSSAASKAGNLVTILDSAVSSADGFEIYDVRAGDQGIIWTEANIFTDVWRIYSAELSGSIMGAATLLDEAGADFETPTLAVVDNFAFWQVCPTSTGAQSNTNSLLKRAQFGNQDTEVVLESPGRMATPPYSYQNSVVVTPRAYTSSVYYQLTLLEAASGIITDTLVLPLSIKPLEAGYGPNGFMFCLNAIYSTSGGIANLGSYTPVESKAPDNYSNSEWFRFNRAPLAAPAWSGDFFIVKSTTAVCGVNLAQKQYFMLEVKSGSSNYGDFLATQGLLDSFVIYANITEKELNEDARKYCLVRVFAPK
jgi:hypothetical protein